MSEAQRRGVWLEQMEKSEVGSEDWEVLNDLEALKTLAFPGDPTSHYRGSKMAQWGKKLAAKLPI